MFGTILEQNNRHTYQKDWETDIVVPSGCHGGGFFNFPGLVPSTGVDGRKNHVGRELHVGSLWV